MNDTTLTEDNRRVRLGARKILGFVMFSYSVGYNSWEKMET